LKYPRDVAIRERDANAGIDREAAVLPGEHVGGGLAVDEVPPSEPADEPVSHALGERREVGRGDRARGEKRDALGAG
jgi:hypothetical protein